VLVSNLEIQLLLAQGERDRAIERIADEVARSPSIVMVVPAAAAVGERDWDSLNRVPCKLDLSIALYAYWRQTEDGLYATYLRFAFEEALFQAGVELPSQFPVDQSSTRPKVIFFLANICIPVLMDTSGLFTSSDAPETDLRLRMGPAVSGSSVLADPEVVEAIKAQHRALVALEMEAYGVLSAARTAPCPRPTAFSLKSVCDMADEKKDDRWQSYAAYTSARSIQAFFERFMTELADIAG
jgi:hypothetical protein